MSTVGMVTKFPAAAFLFLVLVTACSGPSEGDEGATSDAVTATTKCRAAGGTCRRFLGGVVPTCGGEEGSEIAADEPNGASCQNNDAFLCCMPRKETACAKGGGTCKAYYAIEETACGSDIPQDEKRGASCMGNDRFVCCVPRKVTACAKGGGTCREFMGSTLSTCGGAGGSEIEANEPRGASCKNNEKFACCVSRKVTACAKRGGTCKEFMNTKEVTCRGQIPLDEPVGESCMENDRFVCCLPL